MTHETLDGLPPIIVSVIKKLWCIAEYELAISKIARDDERFRDATQSAGIAEGLLYAAWFLAKSRGEEMNTGNHHFYTAETVESIAQERDKLKAEVKRLNEEISQLRAERLNEKINCSNRYENEHNT